MIRVQTVADAAPMDNPHGVEARPLHDSEHAQVVHLTLGPGQGLRRHITPVDVCFYVLAGTGRVEIGDDAREVAADALVESPAGVPHRWQNTGEDALRVLVIKTPRPTERTRLL